MNRSAACKSCFGKSIFGARNFKNVLLFHHVATEKHYTSGKHLLQTEIHVNYSRKVLGSAAERLTTVGRVIMAYSMSQYETKRSY